jgi:hypothetical protein
MSIIANKINPIATLTQYVHLLNILLDKHLRRFGAGIFTGKFPARIPRRDFVFIWLFLVFAAK